MAVLRYLTQFTDRSIRPARFRPQFMTKQGHRDSEKQRTEKIHPRVVAQKDNEPAIQKSQNNGERRRAAIQQKKRSGHRQQKSHVTTGKVPEIFPQMQPLFDVCEKIGDQQSQSDAKQEKAGPLRIRQPGQGTGQENAEKNGIHRIGQPIPLLMGNASGTLLIIARRAADSS